jgi:Holliday junction resolvase RusA-like endonuclease
VGSTGAVERTPLEGDIAVSITLYFGTKRRADLDNFNKLSLNALIPGRHPDRDAHDRPVRQELSTHCN